MDRSTSDGMDPDALSQTRRVLHGVAELLLAGYSQRMGAPTRLHMRDGALSTADLPGPVRRLALTGQQVTRYPDGLEVPLRGTFGDLAGALGVPLGMPDPLYTLASGCSPDDDVTVDPQALAVVLGAWRVGDLALRRFAPEEISVVRPEQLDVAITLDEVDYGVCPGDAWSWRPYAYVGPHTPRVGPFWNAPFGAARALDDLLAVVDGDIGVDDVGSRVAATQAFFRDGLSQL